MKLTQRTFTTTDAGGCEFRCHMTRSFDPYFKFFDGSFIAHDERRYSGLGLTRPTLADLKKAISEL